MESNFSSYERYINYMEIIDTLDTMEGIQKSIRNIEGSFIRQSNNNSHIFENDKENSDIENQLEDDEKSGSDYNPDDTDVEINKMTSDSSKRKTDIENPYRGLKDSGNPLEILSDTDFFNSYKFSKKTVYDIMELIKNNLKKQTNRGSPVPPLIELLITLKYLTTGSIQKKAMNGVSQSTISRINTRITKLIVGLQSQFIKFPDKSEIDKNKIKFYERGKFPEVIGCIGSTHVGVRVRGIKDYSLDFINENGYHSVRIQLIIGPDSQIIDIVSRWPGSTHENKIFEACDVNHKFHSGEIQGVLIGSCAYNPTTVIMTCVKQPQHSGEYYYNEALSNTYMAEECIIQWKKKFKCLQTFLACKPHTQQNIILSCAILHNMAKLNNDPLSMSDENSVVNEVKGNKDNSKKIEVPPIDRSALIHKLMLEDFERTDSYRQAIFNNKHHFEGKVIMDVGAGTGILSIFCAMAGAHKVYAVEASDIASVAKDIIKENKYENIIDVIHSKVENVILDEIEQVDVIISEWMGFYLLHEGMLDSVIYARDKFLKPNGYIYPETATIYMAPCSIPSMFDDWNNIYGVKMNALANLIRQSKNNKPEIMKVDETHILGEETALCWIDLKSVTIEEMEEFTMKQIIGISKDGKYQGMCIWFDCQFPFSNNESVELPIILSTSPFNAVTHWKQTVIVLPEEQVVEKGQPIAWELAIKRSEENNRRYTLQLILLDALNEKHSVPCSCYLTKCIVIKTFLEKNPTGKENTGVINDVDSESGEEMEENKSDVKI